MAPANSGLYGSPMAVQRESPPSPHPSRTSLQRDPITGDDDTRRNSTTRILIDKGDIDNTETPDANPITASASASEPSHDEPPKRHGLVSGRFKPSLVLENSGSVARDHLASERTFLAYVRTSLTIASAGIALFQLFALSNTTSGASVHRYSRPVGATVVALGIVVLVIGVVRYFSVQVSLVKGVYPVARVTPALLAFALLAVVFVVFGILLGARNR